MSNESESDLFIFIMTRSRKFFGTIWTQEDEEILKRENYQYLLISAVDHTKEGQEHKHVFIQYANARRKFPGTRTAHWDVPRNGISGCLRYIRDKGEPSFEDGNIGLDKKSESDWRYFVEQCKVANPREMIDGPCSKMYAQYRGFAGEVHNQFAKREIIQGELVNEWYWGAPGTGKTRKAWEENPNLYVKSRNKWWDGYHGEEVVLLDDWDPNDKCLVGHLKLWADRYPFRGETKGSSMMIRPKKIIITSNYSPEQCFEGEDVKAIRRRFRIVHFSSV